MATPVITAISPKDTWVLVASSVKFGQLTKANKIKNYLHTYVNAGGSAPVGLSLARQWPLNTVRIKSDTLIDVYVYCVADTGSVLVQL